MLIILTLFLQKVMYYQEETSPIEFYKTSHTNRDGLMSEKSQAAYVRIYFLFMGNSNYLAHIISLILS